MLLRFLTFRIFNLQLLTNNFVHNAVRFSWSNSQTKQVTYKFIFNQSSIKVKYWSHIRLEISRIDQCDQKTLTQPSSEKTLKKVISHGPCFVLGNMQRCNSPDPATNSEIYLTFFRQSYSYVTCPSCIPISRCF